MDVVHSSSVDGIGFRDVVFASGCPHRCKGCHNPQTWDGENGRDVSVGEVFDLLTQSKITDVTFSGGEPFCQTESFLELAMRIKKETEKTIWIYSGFLWEELLADENKRKLLELCDVLVDGPFIEEQKIPNLKFRGSLNQRIIDIQKSLLQNDVVLWED